MNNPSITKEQWLEAEDLLVDIGLRLMKYTVVLLNSSQPFGTCVLLEWNKKYYFLTAGHVAQKIGKRGYEKIGIAIIPDDMGRVIDLHPSEAFIPKFWDPKFVEDDLQGDPYQCKDLAIIEIPTFMESIIRAVKSFVLLVEDFTDDLDLQAKYFGQGCVKQDDQFQFTTFGFVLNGKIERDGIDYYTARSFKHTFGVSFLARQNILNFGGYSGGGLFIIKDNQVKLVGIAYYQDLVCLELADGYVEILFHGPASLKTFLKKCAVNSS
jgi:hypothetical protein